MDKDPLQDSLTIDNLIDTPLHKITAELGADGLEQRFRLEIERLEVDNHSKEQINHALELALEVHKEDTRGEDPYSTHFLRVATRIVSHFRVTDTNIIISALLHDTVEDHPMELINELAGSYKTDELRQIDKPAQQEAALYLLGKTYQPEVADIVGAVTNPAFQSNTREERQEEYREHARETFFTKNPKARIVKASDLVDNFAGLRHNPDKEDRLRRIPKYLPLIPDLITAIELPDTPVSIEVKEYLIGQLYAAMEFAEEQLDSAA